MKNEAVSAKQQGPLLLSETWRLQIHNKLSFHQKPMSLATGKTYMLNVYTCMFRGIEIPPSPVKTPGGLCYFIRLHRSRAWAVGNNL